MTQGWCIVGDEVTGQNQTARRAYWSTTQPQATYNSTPQDEAYWGNKYTSFNNFAYSFVDGSYTIFQSDEASCNVNTPPPTPKYDCINSQCIVASQYGTPGVYASLEACQTECGTGNACQAPNICVPKDHCPDGYVCIGADEFAQIKRELG